MNKQILITMILSNLESLLKLLNEGDEYSGQESVACAINDIKGLIN